MKENKSPKQDELEKYTPPERASDETETETYSPQIERELKSINRYFQIAGFCGPVSLVFGGLLVGGIGLILGFIAYRKCAVFLERDDSIGLRAQYYRRASKIAMIICGVCIALNLIAVIFYYPQIIDALTTQNYSYTSSGRATSSTWG